MFWLVVGGVVGSGGAWLSAPSESAESRSAQSWQGEWWLKDASVPTDGEKPFTFLGDSIEAARRGGSASQLTIPLTPAGHGGRKRCRSRLDYRSLARSARQQTRQTGAVAGDRDKISVHQGS